MVDNQVEELVSSTMGDLHPTDTCGPYGMIEVRPNSYAEDDPRASTKQLGPAYTKYVQFDKRLGTFAKWTKSQTPEALSQAGFFHTGKLDQTICFYCGGGIFDWEAGDDPWEEHKKWFPQCNFLLLHLRGAKDATESAESSSREGGEKGDSAASVEEGSSSKGVRETTQLVPLDPNQSECVSAARVPTCKVCYEKEVAVVFIPCGHLATCVDCALSVDRCVICRQPLSATIKTFLC